MQTDCPFCQKENEYAHLEIKRFRYWHVNLHNNQYYLGRSAIILNRHLEDFFDINTQERDELFEITTRLRDGLEKTFGADMLNYATLGNIIRHVHLHVIPRYKEPVAFGGQTFIDENWGQNYAPYNKNSTIPDELCKKLRDKILKVL